MVEQSAGLIKLPLYSCTDLPSKKNYDTLKYFNTNVNNSITNKIVFCNTICIILTFCMNNLHKKLIGNLDSTWKEISKVTTKSPFYICVFISICMCMCTQVLQSQIHKKG